MSQLKGKRLLILGASANEISLVKRAQQLGIYTIVTDVYLDHALSPAKDVADEFWDISWTDTQALTRRCKNEQIDGITAGYSEFRIEGLIHLCNELDLPCYATIEQLDITRDKAKFKTMCRKYDVPVVKEYERPEEVQVFPVIVKPTDRGGSIGISIATNSAQLCKAYEYAMQTSVCKQVIIEDFIYRAEKIDVYYMVENGQIRILTTNDAINATSNGFERVVQSSWLYPERHTKALILKEDQHLRNMIAGMDIKFGCIFFSGFVDENEEFVFFECGFRLEGGHQYEYASRRGPVNFLDLFIAHALTGKTQIVERHPERNPNLKCITINFYAKEGRIAEISGAEEVSRMKDCSLALILANVGQECDLAKAILMKIGMFSFCNEDPLNLKKDIEQAYALFSVKDEHGNDMIYDRIDSSLIEGWWENYDEAQSKNMAGDWQ